MKMTLKFLAFLFAVCAPVAAQVVPEATSSRGLPVNGILHYDLRYSESAEFGGQGNREWSIASGDASYANVRKSLPFAMQYGGGYGWNWGGTSSTGNTFQRLSLSQGIVRRSWNLTASDNVGYSFQTPTIGFSGIPGTGEPIGGTGSTTPPDQTILAQNTRTLDNIATVGFGHKLDYATSLSVGGSSSQMRFIDNNGQNSNSLSADVAVTRRLNRHNSIAGQYSFSRFNYDGANSTAATGAPQLGFSQVNTAQFSITRQWNRRISTSASFGPQWISSSDSSIVPSSTNVAASASISESFRKGGANLAYNHGVQGGSGYMYGGEVDSVDAGYSRSLGRSLSAGLTGGYRRTGGLSNGELTTGEFGGAQATRQLGRYLSVFASYSAIDQSTNLPASTNALNYLTQMIGFGIGYSPREKRLRH